MLRHGLSPFSRKVSYPFILTIGSLLVLVVGCKPEVKKQQGSRPPLEVKVMQPQVKEVVEWDDYAGRFEASRRVEVRPRVGGYIDKVLFDDGQLVEQGDVLFVIDQRPYKIALEEAEASLEAAQASQVQATKERERAERLSKKRAVAAEEFDQRLQDELVAKASVKAAQAVVNNARLNLEFTEVTAPISGRISRDFVNEGNLVTGGTSGATLLTTIVTFDPIHFYFEASEAELLKYTRLSNNGSRPGSRTTPNPVLIKLLDEDEFTHEGKMDFVDNEVDFETGTIQGRALLENPTGIMQPGMFAKVRLLGETIPEALMIPDSAILSEQTQKYVYVVNSEGVVARKIVNPGRLYQQDLRIIRSGLAKDDRVIVDRLQMLRSGAPVKVVSGAKGTKGGVDSNENASKLNATKQVDSTSTGSLDSNPVSVGTTATDGEES